MDSTDDLVKQLKRSPNNVSFADLSKICDHYFGEPRQKSSSHRIYKTPWRFDPRVNIQEKNGKTKPYQVLQVAKAIKKLEAQSGSKGSSKK